MPLNCSDRTIYRKLQPPYFFTGNPCLVHGSIPLPFRRSRSLRHRRRFPNSNLSPARPLSGTIPAAQSAKTKETESKDEKPLHRRGGAGNDLPKIGPDIRNILRSSCFGRRPRASKNHKKRRKRHRTGSETIRERNGKTSSEPITSHSDK